MMIFRSLKKVRQESRCFYSRVIILTTKIDSIAGAMATLKGEPTADPDKPRIKRERKKPVKPAEDEESDYESATDEDEESESETDTDTDSDGE